MPKDGGLQWMVSAICASSGVQGAVAGVVWAILSGIDDASACPPISNVACAKLAVFLDARAHRIRHLEFGIWLLASNAMAHL